MKTEIYPNHDAAYLAVEHWERCGFRASLAYDESRYAWVVTVRPRNLPADL